MRSASGGPRVLLRRLRETMAEQVSAQERLDKIVVLIAANMVAEVCSVYVLRIDNTLELYATEGLNRAAGFLRHELGHRIKLRSIPQLHFIHDESVERGVRLSQLIDAAVSSDGSDKKKTRA